MDLKDIPTKDLLQEFQKRFQQLEAGAPSKRTTVSLAKHPLVIVGAVFVAVIILYFVMSPYQNCLRADDPASGSPWKCGGWVR